MSRQGRTPRPTRGHTMAMQASAANLVEARAAYDGMSPDHPDFEGLFGMAEGAAAAVETDLRRISRPDGLSRRAAASRFVLTSAARAETEGAAVLPAHETAYPPRLPVGAMAIAGVGFEGIV